LAAQVLTPVAIKPHGFSMCLAGGGIKGGITYGVTDDFDWKVVDRPIHVHDIHATILYLMGIDHTKLTFSSSGATLALPTSLEVSYTTSSRDGAMSYLPTQYSQFC
jgi:hypothetical protein